MENLATSFNNPNHNQTSLRGSSVDNNSINDIVALDKVFQAAIAEKTQEAPETNRVIIRCDHLPVVQGNKNDFEKLFAGMISFILDHPPVNCKQFLYVQCKEDSADTDILFVQGNLKMYTINFHTNISIDPHWQMANQAILKEGVQIAEKYKGRLIINNNNSGCLFTLRIAEKSF